MSLLNCIDYNWGDYINHGRVMTGYRYTEYAEGDLLLDIIKEGLVEKHIATGMSTSG